MSSLGFWSQTIRLKSKPKGAIVKIVGGACIFDGSFVVLSAMNAYVNHPFRCLMCTITLMAFLWLSIGFSLAYHHPPTHSAYDLALKKNSNQQQDHAKIPFEQAAEEKAEVSSNDFVSDYLKTEGVQLLHINIRTNYNRFYTARSFVNFSGDAVSPPPESTVC